MNKFILFFFAALVSISAGAGTPSVRGMNLTEIGGFLYDAADANGAKTSAQIAVDHLRAIGVRHIVLNPRAFMHDPRGSDVIPATSPHEIPNERQRYKRLIEYIHSQGMTVGLRPIVLVTKPDGTFPYIETLPDGTRKTWWHGNIQPADPDAWFASFKSYLDVYLLIARLNRVEDFTIGAEFYSMTVGIEDQWKSQPYGFPGRWLALLRYARGKLGATTRISYDANFTDVTNNDGQGVGASGGELERWRYRLVDLANPSDPKENEIWKNLVQFWRELDYVGVDMYRSLLGRNEQVPTDYDALVAKLRVRADSYAIQLDSILTEIDATLNHHTSIVLKEIGFRSVDRGFIDPFAYARPDDRANLEHQAAAYAAILASFWAPGWDWFSGACFWDTSVNPIMSGPNDAGFSPLGKPKTEEVLRRYYMP